MYETLYSAHAVFCNLQFHRAYKSARGAIRENRALLDAIAKRLTEVETIERDESEKLLIVYGITPKKKEDIEHQA